MASFTIMCLLTLSTYHFTFFAETSHSHVLELRVLLSPSLIKCLGDSLKVNTADILWQLWKVSLLIVA